MKGKENFKMLSLYSQIDKTIYNNREIRIGIRRKGTKVYSWTLKIERRHKKIKMFFENKVEEPLRK